MTENKTGAYYQKSSFILKITRYIVVLIFIVMLISCTLIYRNDITIENIQFLAKFITLNDGSSHYYNREFQINTTKNSDVFMLRDNVAIVDKTGIALHELSGSKLFNYTFSYSTPVAVKDTHNILIHDVEGNELSIFNSFSKVFTQKYPYSVRSADINNKGFAVITGEKGYRSALIVYNENFKEYFKWLSEENYLSSVTLSPNGKNTAVTTVKADNGSYKSSVRVFDTSKENPTHVSEEFDELPIYISYSENGKNIYVITDSCIRFYSSSLEEKASYKFNQSKIANYHTHDDLILFTEYNNLLGNSTTITIYKTDGTKISDINVNDSVRDIAFGDDTIYALGLDCVFRYKYSNENNGYKEDGVIPLDEQYSHILCDSENECYIASESTVSRVDFNANGKAE